ncbi:hypothetical protein CDQ84_09860 [Clostridium thermosuccinogenes]|uniref:HAMP domain-containing protein n=1 Tax=Clostridium thermosuccinogenes TaxID=84032 RepID=A0A2K2FDX6_9CLOT|nr:sensor histidine kinase [Pseudoclostridium thermosuccinogenes]AUS96870.1 hypothetical protein CDO33_10720 [Pseudoclostridium thermosuccinogenes]PNT96979.1 hypothetical protein CDQ85_09710 [Pseudoclostridium thermosuccinogenes]PNT98838.1 hypothetical protein CDQ84_09860 [Pseudoclostridium thermosuccinogenes]
MIRNLLDSIKIIYKNSSYQRKLVISFFLLILLPLIILSGFSYYQNKKMIETQSITLSELYLRQVESSINARLSELANTAKALSMNAALTDILKKDPSLTPINEQIEDLRKLDVTVSSYLSSPAVYNIRLYVDSGFLYSNRNVITYNLNSIADAEWAKILKDFYSVVYFTEPYEFKYILYDTRRIISAVVPIRSSSNFEKIIGVVCVDMLEEDLINMMMVADYTSKSEILITNRNYDPLVAYTTIGKPHLESVKDIFRNNTRINAVPVVSVVDNNVIGITPLWNTWKLVSIASMEDLLAAQSDLQLQFFLLIILTTLCVYFLANIYGRYNARRINSLAKQIRVVESGNFNVTCIVDSADEIGELQTSFNYMVRKINSLMKEQYLLGKNLSTMELKVLQEQINPHFLYNTLDLILWTAKRNDMEQVCDIVIKLSKFYRISLNNGSDYIDLINEIEHVRLYTELQNLRFSKKINLVTDIDTSLENFKIMKLLLQPIVENSIIHGITNSDVEQGEIHISASFCDNMVRITVTDNGIGMSQNTISRLITYGEIHTDKEYKGGYGLKNVINRLKLYYDNQAQITFESVPDQGTKVSILIPYGGYRVGNDPT